MSWCPFSMNLVDEVTVPPFSRQEPEMRCPAPHLSSCFLKGWTLLGLRMPCAGSGELGGYGPPPWQCPPAPLLLFAVASWSGVGARPSRTRRPTVQEAGLRAGWGVWAGHMRARSPRCSGLCAWALPASSHWDLRESSFHSGETGRRAGRGGEGQAQTLVSECSNHCGDHPLQSPPSANG